MSENPKKTTDPGATKYGNFINYYQFHSAKERILQLPKNIWNCQPTCDKYIALDVGCNTGVSSNFLCIYMIKIDILFERKKQLFYLLLRHSFLCFLYFIIHKNFFFFFFAGVNNRIIRVFGRKFASQL